MGLFVGSSLKAIATSSHTNLTCQQAIKPVKYSYLAVLAGIVLANRIMLTPALIWSIAGSFLCLMELFFPTALVAFMMGVSALLVALVALVIPHPSVQLLLWLISSTLLIVLTRRFLTPRHRVSPWQDAEEGETLTVIEPGKAGRVMYEGISWRAVCADDQIGINPHEKVYIVNRKGNTLFVLPTNILKDRIS